MTVSNNLTVKNTFDFGVDLKTLNSEMKAAESGKSTASVQFLALKLSMLLINANQDRLATKLKDATSNLNGLTAMNKLKEDLTNLKALRSNNKIDEGKTMESYSSDTKNFAQKAIDAGVSMTADELKNFKEGKITLADIETMESRVKTKQDSYSNTSQADTMDMQKFNTLIGQFTNMGMTFLDEYKKQGERVLR